MQSWQKTKQNICLLSMLSAVNPPSPSTLVIANKQNYIVIEIMSINMFFLMTRTKEIVDDL